MTKSMGIDEQFKLARALPTFTDRSECVCWVKLPSDYMISMAAASLRSHGIDVVADSRRGLGVPFRAGVDGFNLGRFGYAVVAVINTILCRSTPAKDKQRAFARDLMTVQEGQREKDVEQ